MHVQRPLVLQPSETENMKCLKRNCIPYITVNNHDETEKKLKTEVYKVEYNLPIANHQKPYISTKQKSKSLEVIYNI